MTKEYLKSVRRAAEIVIELIYRLDRGELTENEFYIKWTACGLGIIETKDMQSERLK